MTGKIEGGNRTRNVQKEDKEGKPLISVITVVFNAVETLGDSISSVLEQTYSNVEYIVIDGGSTDGTLKIIRSYESNIDYWISEPDSGIYDAMNKGISLASGSIIGFINSDDFYESPEVLAKVAKVFEDPSVDACYGDLYYVSKSEKSTVVRYWQSSDFQPHEFERGWSPPHPTFFVRREVYEQHGKFDLSYRIAADAELMMRFLEVKHVRAEYLHFVLVKMRLGGASNRSLANILKQNKEILHALHKHGLKSSAMKLIGSKIVSRGLQFFRRPKLEI
jgi:glycosyltransferase involved in cell wall biosynthesis